VWSRQAEPERGGVERWLTVVPHFVFSYCKFDGRLAGRNATAEEKTKADKAAEGPAVLDVTRRRKMRVTRDCWNRG
jgi:hypothetical protein